jgi:hypothetical protein
VTGWKVEPDKVSVAAGSSKTITVTLAASALKDSPCLCLVGTLKGGARSDVQPSPIPVRVLVTLPSDA